MRTRRAANKHTDWRKWKISCTKIVLALGTACSFYLCYVWLTTWARNFKSLNLKGLVIFAVGLQWFNVRGGMQSGFGHITLARLPVVQVGSSAFFFFLS